MPEGPEVRVICEYLDKRWRNKLVIGFYWDEKSKFHRKGIKGQELALFPLLVKTVRPRGKLIIIECLNRNRETIYMVSQLGMEGKWTQTKTKHSNFTIYLGSYDWDKEKYTVDEKWYFDDSRHFGHFNIYSDLNEIIKKHGPCLLTTSLVCKGLKNLTDLRDYQSIATIEMFTEKIKNSRIKNKEICVFLMEQRYFSGIGNYLRSEILYKSELNPRKTLGSMTDEDINGLYETIISQMILSYGAKGLTIKSYWDPEGRKGRCPLEVYNRDHDPMGNPVEKFKDKTGRMVHWVSSVQVK